VVGTHITDTGMTCQLDGHNQNEARSNMKGETHGYERERETHTQTERGLERERDDFVLIQVHICIAMFCFNCVSQYAFQNMNV